MPRTHPNVSRRSAHPSFGVSEAESQTPDANASRERDVLRAGLFDIVNGEWVTPMSWGWTATERGSALRASTRLLEPAPLGWPRKKYDYIEN